jgi:hypothetical protein
VNGQFVSFPDRTIAGTGEEAVYKDIRDRVLGYRLSVPEGTYAVTLKFVESEFDRRNVRVFDVLVQGKRVAEKVDIFARAGRDKAYDLTFKDVAAPQGRLVIDFTDRIHYPSIAALVVEGTTAAGEAFVKRVNCGGPAVAGYEADWPETPRHLPALDFYRDWARNQFGPAAGEDAAGIFAGLDGKLPMPVQWTDGPGGIVPDPRPWASVAKAYGFVDALAAVQPKVLGAGAKDRFDYWLRTFEYHREIAHYRCLWGEYNAALEGVKKLGPAEEKAAAARETLVPARVKMIASLKALMGHLLATVSNTGELGTIANWEQHLLPPSIEKPGEELANLLGGPLPVEAEVPLVYEGPARIIVPTVRASLETDEALKLRVIVLGAGEADKVELFWRTMGAGAYAAVPLTNIGRSVFRVELPAPAADIEYYLKTNVGGKDVFYPAGAPAAAQTVVVIPGAVR